MIDQARTGVLFSRPMVQALRALTKTETRRIAQGPDRDGGFAILPCPYGQVGDLLYCKETCVPAARSTSGGVLFAADYAEDILAGVGRWKPSIMMAEHEARLWYRLTRIRLEKLSAITEEDARAEGVAPAVDGSYVSAYAQLWNEINSRFKPVKSRVDGSWRVTHYVSFPWGGQPAVVQYRGLPAYVTPNPYVYALTLAPVSAPGTAQEIQ